MTGVVQGDDCGPHDLPCCAPTPLAHVEVWRRGWGYGARDLNCRHLDETYVLAYACTITE